MCKRVNVFVLFFIIAVLFFSKPLEALDSGYGSNDGVPSKKVVSYSVSVTGFKVTKKDLDLISLIQKPVPEVEGKFGFWDKNKKEQQNKKYLKVAAASSQKFFGCKKK